MTNLYENGEGDSRQSEESSLPPSLFRKRYRQLTADEVVLHDAIKDKADELACLIDSIPAGPHSPKGPDDNRLDYLALNKGGNVTLSLRDLESCVFRAIKALTT
jgi:hypothetical protein